MHTKKLLINIQIYTHTVYATPVPKNPSSFHHSCTTSLSSIARFSSHQTWPLTSLPPLSVLVATDRRQHWRRCHCYQGRLGVIHATRRETGGELLPSSFKESIHY